jgi:hypothetical protein
MGLVFKLDILPRTYMLEDVVSGRERNSIWELREFTTSC